MLKHSDWFSTNSSISPAAFLSTLYLVSLCFVVVDGVGVVVFVAGTVVFTDADVVSVIVGVTRSIVVCLVVFVVSCSNDDVVDVLCC